MANTPEQHSASYARCLPHWTRARDAMGGTLAVRAKREEYCPRFSDEDDATFDLRLEGGVFYNGFTRTLDTMVGLALQEPPALQKDVPDRFVREWESIDQRGRHGNRFVADLLWEAMALGCAGIFVDMPDTTEEFANEAAEEAAGHRPYWRLIRGDDVWHIVMEQDGVRQWPTHLVLREHAWRRDGRFGSKPTTRYREYVRRRGGRVEWFLWEEREDVPKTATVGSRYGVTRQGVITNQTHIPFAPLAVGRGNHAFYRVSALQDLLDVNYRHYLTDVARQWNLTMVGYGVAVRVGAAPDKDGNYPSVPLGPTVQVDVPLQGDFKFVAPPADAFVHQQKSQRDDEARMGALGMQFLQPDFRATETADAKRMDESATHASLRTTIAALQDCTEEAMMFHGRYIRQPDMGKIAFNVDFERRGLNPKLLLVLSVLNTRGQLTLDTLLTTIKTGRLPDGFSVEDEINKLWTEQLERIELDRLRGEAGGGGTADDDDQEAFTDVNRTGGRKPDEVDTATARMIRSTLGS